MRKKGLWKKSASILIAAAMMMTSVPVFAAPQEEAAEVVIVQEQEEAAENEAEEILLEEEAAEEASVGEITEGEDSEEAVKEGSGVSVEMDGGMIYYGTLGEAIQAADERTATITLLEDVVDEEPAFIMNGTDVTLDLNGHSVGFAEEGALYVMGASLHVTGTGTLYEQVPTFGTIVVRGNTENTPDYTNIVVDQGVTLKGWSGISIDNYDGYAYGVKVNFNGTIQGLDDTGYGIYINGSVQRIDGSIPEITIGKTASITTPGAGIYAAGHAKWDLQGGSIEGTTALSIKSGIFNISGGTYHATGSFSVPPVADSNGEEETGVALSITSNDAYAQKTVVTVTGGTFTSDYGCAVYEGIAKYEDGSLAAAESYATLKISKGFFMGSDVVSPVLLQNMKNKKVISGGYFSSKFSTGYLVTGKNLLENKDKYKDQGYEYVVRALGTDASLSALKISKGSLSPKFSASQKSYEVIVENSVSSMKVTPTAKDSNSTVTVNGKTGAQKVSLKVGYNTIKVKVTSEDGKSTNTYTIKVTRVVPKNYTITIRRRKYKVTNQMIATAALEITGLSDKKVVNLSVPDTVKIYGVTYKITSVGNKAFLGQPKMKTAKLGKNITTVKYGSFYDCPLLNSITFGKNVKTIGNHVFCWDKKLRTMTFEGTALTSVGDHTLYKISSLTIKAPSSKVSAYKKLFTNKGTKSFKVVKK